MRTTIATAILLGIGLGTFSVLGDWLPVDTPLVVLVALANAIGPWIAVAFAAGALARTPRRGAWAGAATLAVAIVTYYVGTRIVWGDVVLDPVRATAVWGVVAVIAGAPLGAAGGAWARRDERWRVPSVAAVSGLLLAEAISRFMEVEGWTGIDLGRTALQVAAVDGLAAILGPIMLLESGRRAGYVATIGVAIGGSVILAGAMVAVRGALFGPAA